jgi:hypothetical protein
VGRLGNGGGRRSVEVEGVKMKNISTGIEGFTILKSFEKCYVYCDMPYISLKIGFCNSGHLLLSCIPCLQSLCI